MYSLVRIKDNYTAKLVNMPVGSVMLIKDIHRPTGFYLIDQLDSLEPNQGWWTPKRTVELLPGMFTEQELESAQLLYQSEPTQIVDSTYRGNAIVKPSLKRQRKSQEH